MGIHNRGPPRDYFLGGLFLLLIANFQKGCIIMLYLFHQTIDEVFTPPCWTCPACAYHVGLFLFSLVWYSCPVN